jgi:hypothetical protein
MPDRRRATAELQYSSKVWSHPRISFLVHSFPTSLGTFMTIVHPYRLEVECSVVQKDSACVSAKAAQNLKRRWRLAVEAVYLNPSYQIASRRYYYGRGRTSPPQPMGMPVGKETRGSLIHGLALKSLRVESSFPVPNSFTSET